MHIGTIIPCAYRYALGVKPLEHACHLSTDQLARAMIDYLKDPDDMKELYTRHLELPVRDANVICIPYIILSCSM